jgi:hypothetical protein
MRKRITYANVAATLALVFSMTGGALAAKHYLINSTNQINPKVLKKLKAPGATGKTGAQGLQGLSGKDGAPGTAGKEGARGPSNGYQAFNDFPGTFTGTKALGKLTVPPGAYLVGAKIAVENTSTVEEVLVDCELVNDQNGDKDLSQVVLPKKGIEWFGEATVSLQAASTIGGSGGTWTVKCGGFGGPTVEGRDLKIQATHVETLSNSNA